MVKNKLQEVIRDQDMFGHVISLNFNKKGETHTTVIGGFFSFLIKIAFTVYCWMCVDKLVNYGDNNLDTTKLKIDIVEFGPVDLSKTNYYSFNAFKKQTVPGGTLKINKEFYQNLDIFYLERKIDWNKPPD